MYSDDPRKISLKKARSARLKRKHDELVETYKSGVMTQIDPSKPREEHHYRDIYPDLDEEASIPVFVSNSQIDDEFINNVNKQTQFKLQQLKKPKFNKIPDDILNSNQDVKIARSVTKFGYRNNVSSVKHATESTYIKEVLNQVPEDTNFISKLSSTQMMFKSQYDMDEQDNHFLKYLQDLSYGNLTNEIFEILITIIENEWFYLESKIPPKIRDFNSNKNVKLNKKIQLYGSDDGISTSNSIDDQNCAVCDSNECDNLNAIIFCDGCDIAVHQDCYGVLFIPEGQWLCRKCMFNKNLNQKLYNKKQICQFCPSITGAFKQITNGNWSHVLCGLWIPELYFASINHMEPIEGFELIPKGRWRLNCFICKKKGVGACVQCFNKNCVTAFHVTCAKRSGLTMIMTKGIQGAVLDKSSLRCYCPKHGDQSNLSEIKNNIEKTRAYFKMLEGDSFEIQKFPIVKKSSNSHKKRWKSSKGTPLAPNYFIDIVAKVIKELMKLDEKISEELSTLIVKYWNLKKELKKGAPLIRKNSEFSPLSYNNHAISSMSNSTEMIEKLSFSKVMLEDLNKLEELASLVIKREKARQQADEILHEQLDLTIFKHNHLIKQIFDKIKTIKSTKFIYDVPNLSIDLKRIEEKFSNLQYISVLEFLGDVRKIFDDIDHLEDGSVSKNILIKVKTRVLREIDADLKLYTDNKFEDWVSSEMLKDFTVDGLNIDIQYRGISAMIEEDLSELEEEIE